MKYLSALFILFLMSLTACGPSAIYTSAGTPVVGPQGPAGQDAMSTQVIKLCDHTPVYPTVFVEYGICVNNQLYAVYSANGGFLTLLPPGNYNSNAIGSACNLTVSANCVVSH